jgi:catechol 2,3-dioxygenase-like lactoylglutathione lyase family enzyme
MTPPVAGVLETALYVADLDRAAEFYRSVFGFRDLLREDSRLHAMSMADRQVLLLFRVDGSLEPTRAPGGWIPEHGASGRSHLAFAIECDALEQWREHLREKQVAIESEVDTPRGGKSVYFRDPDGHLLELVTPGCWEIY